jgi:hypothetical protein
MCHASPALDPCYASHAPVGQACQRQRPLTPVQVNEDGQRESRSRRARGETQCACARVAVGHHRACCACHACPQFPSQGCPPRPPCLPCRCCACRIPPQAVATAKLQNVSQKNMFSVFGFNRKSWNICPAKGRTELKPMSGQEGNPTASTALLHCCMLNSGCASTGGLGGWPGGQGRGLQGAGLG